MEQSAKGQLKAAADLRNFFLAQHNDIKPVSQQQAAQNAERPVKGPIWVSRFALPAPPEPDLGNALWRVVQQLGDGSERITRPSYAPSLDANWTGPRPGVPTKEPEPSLPEGIKFKKLMGAIDGAEKTVFFLQGGGFVYGSLSNARSLAAQLTHRIRARVLTIAYRLSPTHTFPAFVLDALTAYFSLLSPPPGSLYAPIAPDCIVLGGESAGAALALALVQILLHLRRTGTLHMTFNGRRVPVALPAGVVAIAPAADVTVSLPSNTRFRSLDWTFNLGPWLAPNCPADNIWPSDPPRGEIYADASALAHPLLTVAAARDWEGAPPMLIATGQECMTDSTAIVAQRAAEQGVRVQYVQYEGMLHSFYSFLPKLPQTKHLMDCCAKFCTDVLASTRQIAASTGVFYKLGDLEPVSLDMRRLAPLTHQEALDLIQAGRSKRMTWVWNGPSFSKGSSSSSSGVKL